MDLPGSADEDPGADEDLPLMKGHFLASPWASGSPEEIEIAIETVVSGIAIRGRIDAVFRRSDGGFTVVDWKTGARPTGATATLRAIQLGAYRLAFARLRELPPDRVDAAFFYAATGESGLPRPAGRAGAGPPPGGCTGQAAEPGFTVTLVGHSAGRWQCPRVMAGGLGQRGPIVSRHW